MADYQQLRAIDGSISSTVKRTADGAFIPDDPRNRDRQRYNEWLAEGNVPDPPDPLPEPAPPAPLRLPDAAPDHPLDAAPKAYVDSEIARAMARMEAMIRGPRNAV